MFAISHLARGRARLGVLLPILAALAGTVPTFGQVLDLGTFDRRSGSTARPVSVTSTDARTLGLVQRAFDAHGAYALTTADRAAFVFRFEPAGGDRVRLSVESGRPVKVLFQQEVVGSGWVDATLRAADLAVAKTTESLSGFFAGRLAFISDRTGQTEVYYSDVFFEEVRRLTSDNARAALPKISPSGQRVVYTTYHRTGFPDLFAFDVATGRRELFLGFSGTNTSGAFSPAGSSLAVILSGTGNAELYVCNAQGRNLQRLTRSAALESGPTWAPDGTRLVYASDAPGKPQLYEISAVGGTPRRLPTNISGYCAEPAWNPRDANLLAFTAASGGDYEVALYDFTARRSRILTSGPGDAVEPVWMRDGRHLVYTERTAKYRRLVVLDTVSGKKSALHRPQFGNTYQATYAYPAGRQAP